MATHFKLSDFIYAHRGLWTKDGPPENTLAAYRAAALAGYGLEYDLRPSKDGEAILFHDPSLERMSLATGQVEDLTSDELKQILVRGSDETVPLFQDLLDLWPPTLPLITELKIDGRTDPAAFARRVGARLMTHSGPAALISFSIEAVAAMPKELMRGQLAYPIFKTSESAFQAKLEHGQRAGVDFMCVWHEDAPKAYEFTSKAGMDLCVFTVRSAQQHRALIEAVPNIGGIIFEHYDPKAI